MLIWKELQELKEIFIACLSLVLGEGSQIRFLKEKLIHNEQLKYVTPRIFEQSKKKKWLG